MTTQEENLENLRIIKRSLLRAHDEVTRVMDFMEAKLTTESDRAMSKEYSSACRALVILEEQIARISNQLNRINRNGRKNQNED